MKIIIENLDLFDMVHIMNILYFIGSRYSFEEDKIIVLIKNKYEEEVVNELISKFKNN